MNEVPTSLPMELIQKLQIQATNTSCYKYILLYYYKLVQKYKLQASYIRPNPNMFILILQLVACKLQLLACIAYWDDDNKNDNVEDNINQIISPPSLDYRLGVNILSSSQSIGLDDVIVYVKLMIAKVFISSSIGKGS